MSVINHTFQRGNADKPAEPIVEPLLSGSLRAATEKGRLIIDAATRFRDVTIKVIAPSDKIIYPADLILIENTLEGVIDVGTVESVQYSYEDNVLIANLTLEVV